MSSNSTPSVIVVGAGLAGFATAITAAERGCQVTLLEKSHKVGGAAAFSGGLVWVPANHAMAAKGLEDSVEAAAEYIVKTGEAHSHLLEEDAMRTWLSTSGEAAKYFEDLGVVTWDVVPTMPDYHYPAVAGSTPEGRFLSAKFDGEKLGPWRDRLRVSPHFPVGTTYDELFSPDLASQMQVSNKAKSAESESSSVGYFSSSTSHLEKGDLLTMGTGVVASFLAYAAGKDAITVLTGHEVTELVTENGSVVGAKATGPDGPTEFSGSVVITTSGYDWDPDLVEQYAELAPDDAGSVAPQTLSGAGMRLARQVGGSLLKFPGQCIPMVPGHRVEGTDEFRYAHEYAYPHCFLVDERGERFADDSYYTDICWKALEPGDRHMPIYLVWDDEHRSRYGGAGTAPGGTYPSLVKSAETMEELGALLGIDGDTLARTREAFNEHAVRGEDPAFGRGGKEAVRKFSGDPAHELHPNVAPVAKAPFHGMRVRLITAGIGMSGIHVDPVGRVVDDGGRPVPGLFAAGAAAAFTASGTGYQSGYSLSRAVTLGYTAANTIADEATTGSVDQESVA